MMGFGWIFWLVIIGGGIWMANQLTNGRDQRSSTSGRISRRETPLDILKKRYASGEISESEFKEMRRNL